MDRRTFLETCAAAGAVFGSDLNAALHAQTGHQSHASDFGPESIVFPDNDWNLWIDESAPWQDDEIFLPEDVLRRQRKLAEPISRKWLRLSAPMISGSGAPAARSMRSPFDYFSTPVLVHRAPAFSAPLQSRWLANAMSHLTSR